jgi:hypothetical protein
MARHVLSGPVLRLVRFVIASVFGYLFLQELSRTWLAYHCLHPGDLPVPEECAEIITAHCDAALGITSRDIFAVLGLLVSGGTVAMSELAKDPPRDGSATKGEPPTGRNR